MTCNHKIGIRGGLRAIGAALILFSLPAAAQSSPADQARQWCFGSSEINDDRRIEGCSTPLQADPSNAAVLFNRAKSFRHKKDLAAAKAINAGIADAFEHLAIGISTRAGRAFRKTSA
ncbi:hypothetical protein QWJ07_21505 [Frankia sp. RB7]|nr:hypothetical protein [Frankia sp. RB7]